MNLVRRRLNPLRALVQWAAGTRRESVDQCGTEGPWFSAIGTSVILIALMNGWAVTYALSLALGKPAGELWPYGLVWGFIVLTIDRLLLIVMSGARGRVLAVLPRLVMSVVLGLIVAEPLTMKIFGGEIASYLQAVEQATLASRVKAIDATYTSNVTKDQQDIASWQAKESALEAQVTHYQFLMHCEQGETDCSTSHQVGTGPYALMYQGDAANAQSQLQALTPQATAQIAVDQTDIAFQNKLKTTSLVQAQQAVSNGGGLLAHEEALGHLMTAHPDAVVTVNFVRLAFIIVDLVPALFKLGMVLAGRLAYDEMEAAAKRRELTRAKQWAAEAEVEEDRIDKQAWADREVNGVLIDIERERRIAQAMGAPVPEWPASVTSTWGNAANESPIAAPSLSQFVANAKAHEHMAIPMPDALRRAGFIGLGLLAGLLALVIAADSFMHVLIVGTWLVLTAVCAGLALLTFTRGFETGPGWTHRAALGTLITGLAMPPLLGILSL